MKTTASSPSHGEDTLAPENEAQRHLAKRHKPEKSKEEDEESYPVPYSLVAHFQQRATQTENLERVLQQWCQKDKPAIEDLQDLAPLIFGLKSSTNRNQGCSCEMCRGVTELEKSCARFLTGLDEYDADYEQRANTIMQPMPYDPFKKIFRMQEVIPCWVDATKAKRICLDATSMDHKVAVEAELIFVNACLLSGQAKSVQFSAKSFVARNGTIEFLLEAVRCPGIDIFFVQDEDASEYLDDYRFNYIPQSNPSDFVKLCNPPPREFDEFDFFPSLESNRVALLHQFYKHLKRIFGTALILDANDEQYSRKIE